MNKVGDMRCQYFQLPVLPNHKMTELFKRMLDNEPDAREALIKGNLRLVLSVIQRFNNRGGENVDDLFQVDVSD